MGRLSVEEIKSLDVGQKLLCIFRHGSVEYSHPARYEGKAAGYARILVYFTDQPQRLVRWSFVTNKPIKESRGYTGDTWLSLPCND